jgi:catechol 2,3-dioxygenase-like lactoylglutathione lyase family enzyme
VQLAMPKGEEGRARHFYQEVLGMRELEKPAGLKGRGGCWFELDGCHVHLGVDDPFVPARKAHPAFVVADLDALANRLSSAGYALAKDDTVAGVDRIYSSDPFGNRLEFIRAGHGFSENRPGPSSHRE